MVAGSFFLTPATAIRYERHDRRVRQVSKEEELGIGKDRRKVDINEEYYRLAAKVWLSSFWEANENRNNGRMCTQDLDNWQNKRVKRLPGEHDGIL